MTSLAVIPPQKRVSSTRWQGVECRFYRCSDCGAETSVRRRDTRGTRSEPNRVQPSRAGFFGSGDGDTSGETAVCFSAPIAPADSRRIDRPTPLHAATNRRSEGPSCSAFVSSPPLRFFASSRSARRRPNPSSPGRHRPRRRSHRRRHLRCEARRQRCFFYCRTPRPWAIVGTADEAYFPYY